MNRTLWNEPINPPSFKLFSKILWSRWHKVWLPHQYSFHLSPRVIQGHCLLLTEALSSRTSFLHHHPLPNTWGLFICTHTHIACGNKGTFRTAQDCPLWTGQGCRLLSSQVVHLPPGIMFFWILPSIGMKAVSLVKVTICSGLSRALGSKDSQGPSQWQGSWGLCYPCILYPSVNTYPGLSNREASWSFTWATW
jgi:hypothetical protein